jgi:hypothetical protein
MWQFLRSREFLARVLRDATKIGPADVVEVGVGDVQSSGIRGLVTTARRGVGTSATPESGVSSRRVNVPRTAAMCQNSTRDAGRAGATGRRAARREVSLTVTDTGDNGFGQEGLTDAHGNIHVRLDPPEAD